jgi:hypothetical protein
MPTEHNSWDEEGRERSMLLHSCNDCMERSPRLRLREAKARENRPEPANKVVRTLGLDRECNKIHAYRPI